MGEGSRAGIDAAKCIVSMGQGLEYESGRETLNVRLRKNVQYPENTDSNPAHYDSGTLLAIHTYKLIKFSLDNKL